MKIHTLLLIAIILSVLPNHTEALDFKTLSHSLAVIQDDSGCNLPAVLLDFGDGEPYAVTTQSVFFTNLQNLKILDFKGNKLEINKVQISTDRDIIRFKIVKNKFTVPCKIAEQGSSLYVMNPKTGIISSGKFSTKKLPARPGSIVMNQTKAVGLISSVTGFTQAGVPTSAFIKLSGLTNWKDCDFQKFRIQVRQLKTLSHKLNSLEKIEALHQKNTFIPFNDYIHPSLQTWLKNHNQVCEDYLLSPNKKGKTMGVAKTQHLYRCYYYGEMKSMQSVTKNIIQSVASTAWLSNYLKKGADALSQRAVKIKISLQAKIDGLMLVHPATKNKL